MRAIVPIVLASLPFLAILVLRPVLRRLALRNAARRPRESALVVLGSMLGTAILTGSFVVGDTLEASLRRTAHEQLGPVDEVVAGRTSVSHPDVDGVLPMTLAGPAAVATVTQPRRAAPRSQLIEIDFARARAFGGDASATGIGGPTPAAGRAAISRDLGDLVGIGEGDALEVFAYGRSVRLVVDRVLPRRGVAGFSSGGPDGRPKNLFVAPGTIASLAGPAATGPQRPQSLVLVSNRGGVEEGVVYTDAVVSALAGPGVQVRTVKRDVLRGAEQAGAMFSQLFTAMGTFGVIAGVLLLVNIFVMLAEERRPELGMMRALGLRRSSLVAAFALEGWVYALAAAAVGSVVGIGLGRVIGVAAAGVFSGGFGGAGGAIDLTFAAKASSVRAGFALGFLIALGTVVFTSVRISRFNVIQAIRDLSEAEPHRTSRRSLLFGVAGLVVGLVWSLGSLRRGEPMGSMIAPIVVAASLVPIVGRVAGRRLVTSAAAVLALAWGVIGMRFFREAAGNATLTLFVAQGVVLTGSAVALVSVNQETIGAVVRRIGGGSRSLALRLGLAYPLARRFRTGMTLAMYTLVIFTLTFITVFSHIVQSQVRTFARDAAGGFDIIVTSNANNPVDPGAIGSRRGVTGVAPLRTTFVEFTTPPQRRGQEEQIRGGALSAFDERFVQIGAPALGDKLAEYSTDADAYRAVLQNPGLIVINPFFLQGRRAGPPTRVVDVGDTITITDTHTLNSRRVKVAALMTGGAGATGALYGMSGAAELFGDRLVTNPVYVATDGVDNERVASELSAAYLANGVEASAIQSLITQARSREFQFFGLIRGYLALGLIVGIAGLGVIMVRAVRERRRQIGVLRALGFDPRAVRRSFVIESGFVALEGVLIGVALALVNAYSLVATSEVFGGNLQWRVPVGSLLVLVLGTLAVSLLATAAPSQAAARIRPAVALRIAD